MLTRAVLLPQELLEYVRELYSNNNRGEVLDIAFFDAEGKEMRVAWIDIVSEERGLHVGARPLTIEEQVRSAYGAAGIRAG